MAIAAGIFSNAARSMINNLGSGIKAQPNNGIAGLAFVNMFHFCRPYVA